LLGNAELLRRALENVVRNAIRYAPDGSEIELRARSQGATTVISVRDSGRGVPEALLPRLTEPFFRVDDARDALTGGVGLGLSITQRAVHLHQGTLRAENANPGLRVTISLPAAPAAKSA
jgi:two-component system sensor histidine kinase CpxA